MKAKNRFILSAFFGLLFVLLIILILFCDVAPIGPQGTEIGLSGLNKLIFDLFGVNYIWYEITDWLGFAALVTAFIYACAGFIQMIKKKSIIKVDGEILALGCLYIIVIGLYILFENAIVNYRPVIMPGCINPEASFPSSHTMLVCVIMGSAIILTGKYVKIKALRVLLRIICVLTIVITVAGRLISGIHWFTDVVGGILISAAMLELFSGTVTLCKKMQNNDCTVKNDDNEETKMTLETERLTLKIASKEEMESYIKLQTDEELIHAYKEMLQGCLDFPEQWEWYAIWMIEHKDGTHIGDLSFKGLNADGSVEIGYGISEQYRLLGYATEAVNAAVDWALIQKNVLRVEAETAPDNAASQRVLQKCGFVPLGTVREEGPRFVKKII